MIENNKSMLATIKQKAAELMPDIISIRRHLHTYPELSFDEKNTSEFIASKLAEVSIPFTKGWAGYGIVATIKGQSDETIALRGDMDALPILEKNDVEYASKNIGIMHACGHDVHTASLLGAAMILQSVQDSLPYTIRLVFQPGEEKLPGGASLMINEGVLKGPAPFAMIGQHVFPSLEVGNVGIRSGLYMASADEIYLTITGKGGHGAMPHEVTDTVLAACQSIVALQQIVSRNANPTIPSVLSFGKFNTIGGATNIIPDQVTIEGTFRTMDETWRKKAHDLIERVVKETCFAFGANAEIQILKGYPCLVNDVSLTQKIRKNMEAYLGQEHVVDLDIRMTSEDFAFYSQQLPSVFYRLGTGNASLGIDSPVHTSTFDIDENALEIGMGLMAWLALNH